MNPETRYDLVVIGGGVNGVGIARDAAGRGLRVLLCEQDDLAAYTSSSSTKLIHGGLRYLEHYEFRLVREALQERERLLRIAPHIIQPLRFVLPHDRHLRPAWMIRAGLLLYDHLGGHRHLPASGSIDLRRHPAGKPLNPRLHKAFIYSDCRVQDARLVILNAMDARQHGATILTRTRCERVTREADGWRVYLRERSSGATRTVRSRGLVNAAGPWCGDLFGSVIPLAPPADLRLVKGSHIVVPRLFQHGDAYVFQQPDHRIVFAIPYKGDYTLIGTTDVDYDGDPAAARITAKETEYLCVAANHYFRSPIGSADVVWSYAGVRPLYADTHKKAASVTRDYVLKLTADDGQPPLLTVYGGKLTTYRRLAEHALEQLRPALGFKATTWTDRSPLPGGDIENADFNAFLDNLRRSRPWLPPELAARLAHSYGTRIDQVLDGARSIKGLGRCLGADLFESEVRYLVNHEWACTADDILWRRSKLGLRFSSADKDALEAWLAHNGELVSAQQKETAA